MMRKNARRWLMGLLALVLMTMLTGCTNWKKEYEALDVEHNNLKGLYESCIASLDSTTAEQASLTQQLNQKQMTIEELQKQIQQKKATPADATGFKVGDVKVDERAGTITVTLPNSILFSSGSATLRRATSSELDHIYSVLRERYSGKNVDIVGHTDADPIRKTKNKWKDNWDLSAGRALTVLRYLKDRGMRAEKIRAVACGQSRPVASNSNSSGKARNRRVEIVVHMR